MVVKEHVTVVQGLRLHSPEAGPQMKVWVKEGIKEVLRGNLVKK